MKRTIIKRKRRKQQKNVETEDPINKKETVEKILGFRNGLP